METLCIEIPEEFADCRVDKAVSSLMDDRITRSFLQKIIKEGKLTVNGRAVKTSYQVEEGDEVIFDIPDPVESNIEPESIPLEILYEDQDLLIVNKPKGMVVHPAAGHYSGTLVNAIMHHCQGNLSGINGVLRPGIVHRIDKDTSGSLVICKNDFTHNGLAAQFKEHSITRTYLAICDGALKEESLTIEGNIGRSDKDRKKMAVVVGRGKPAITHIKVVEHLKATTYVECALETGRTHQIRVHMSHIHHPLLGDLVYGNKDYKGLGQMLHAYKLGFIHPRTGQYLEVCAELPEYFKDYLKKNQ